MDDFSLYAISPVDGRYRKQTGLLAAYFSEAGLIRYRVMVEVEYFIALCQLDIPQLKDFEPQNFEVLRGFYETFPVSDALRIKEIEQTTNHDVKAVEYFLREKFDQHGWGRFKEFIHLGLTSQDVNNTAQPYALKTAHQLVILPVIHELVEKLRSLALQWKDIPMLARTHGQPASPTLLGKEIFVFTERLVNQLDMLSQIPFAGKFGGATGNFNAHYAAYPNLDWHGFADGFVQDVLGLQRLKTTTQIDHYDYLAAYFDNLKRINTILIDFCRDVWTYISIEYFRQEINEKEVGSSAMPHKVNPIDFENAEGNLGFANAIFSYLSAKLPVSRLQRDLTDSTVMRNVGVPLGHMLIAFRSLQKGINKLKLNREALNRDLENNWAVLAEGIQTILRRESYPDPYSALKNLTRTNQVITQMVLLEFIESLYVAESVKEELKNLRPENYTGRFIISDLE
ncbi:MAG: adenylosuccinate lyase [Bacteroidales bacterium]|nr:adenylosuccinate lyase [Bacteroidales bacterium]